MHLASRLRRLEQTSRREAPAQPCDECGGPTSWRTHPIEPASYNVRGVHPNEPPTDVPDVCPGCGRTVVYHIEFDRGGAARVAVLAWVCVIAAFLIGAALWA